MPWEGHIVSFNGSKGRLEHVCRETCYFSGDGSLPGELMPEGTSTKIFPHFLPGYAVDIWQSEGSHGGGDAVLLEDLFAEHRQADKYQREADQRAGAWSILTGIAVSRSLEWGKPVRLDELVQGLAEPDYPPMPSAQESLESVLDQPGKGKYRTGI